MTRTVNSALACVLGLTLAVLSAGPAAAADFLVVLDLSGSMGSAAAMEPAKAALSRSMEEISTPGARWGLRVYGTGCCSPDTELAIPLSRDGRREIAALLPGLRGIAGSPMPAALAAAREGELERGRPLWKRRNVIIVSDGVVDREGGCREARLLRQDGVRVTVIGLEEAGSAEGTETLRYIATDPECAAGHYIRVDRPDLLGEVLVRLAAALFGFPYRLIALFLAIVAGYYTTKFFEYALERLTRMRRQRIPQLCTAAFLCWMLASAGLFLGSARPGVLPLALGALGIIPAGLSVLLAKLKETSS